MANKTDCNKKEHKMHMCELTGTGFDKKDPAKFREITENPEFKCGNCGAKANKRKNLCNPKKL